MQVVSIGYTWTSNLSYCSPLHLWKTQISKEILHEYDVLHNSQHDSHSFCLFALLRDGKLHPVSQELASVTCLKLVMIRFNLWL